MQEQDEPAPTVPQPASPFRPLLIWLGPLFALINASLYPVLCAAVLVFLSMRFSLAQPRGGPPPPLPGFNWLPVLLVMGLALVSLIPAQALLLSLCLTWSGGAWWRRLAKYWLAVLAAVGAGLAGVPVFWFLVLVQGWAANNLEATYGVYGRHVDFEARLTLAGVCALPMILLGVQAPFWVIRLLTGRRLVRKDSTAREETKHALSISDLLLATALVAVSLALLQFADRMLTPARNEALSLLFGTPIVTAVCLVASLLTAVPLVFLFFSRYSLRLCWAVTLFAAGTCAVALSAIVPAASMGGRSRHQFIMTCVLAYGYAGGSAAGLTVLRRSGWRLSGRNE